ERVGQQSQILVPVAAGAKVFRESGNGLVGDCIKLVKDDPVIALKGFAIVGFQFGLRWRQSGTDGVVNEIQRQAGSVAGGVELLERRDALLVNARAALFGDVLRQVTRQRRDHFDFVPRQILRQIFETRLEQN